MPSLVYKLLIALRRHPGWTWLGVVVYAATVTLPHENVQTWVGQIAKRIGRHELYVVAGGIGIAGGLVLTLIVLRKAQERIVAVYWVLTMCLIIATWRLLTANNTELVHYPQYIPEGMALLVLTLSPAESLAWVILFGGIDEAFQYSILHGRWGIPYDFNDIYMDVLGGALGILIAARFLPVQQGRGSLKKIILRPGVVVILGIAAAGLVLLASGRMLLFKDAENTKYWFALSRMKHTGFWFFDETWGPHTFHTLSPIEGPLLILATLGLFAFLDARLRILAKP